MNQFSRAVAVLLVVGVCSLVLFFWETPLAYLKATMEGNNLIGYSAFVFLLIVATVCAPITVMPVIPMGAMVFGPFITALLSIIGWTAGATFAFFIARHFGRPLITRIASIDPIDRLIARLPDHAQFILIVLLRMSLPVDIVSYALGLSATVRTIPYIGATVLGVTWFSFAFAYLGDAFFTQNTLVLFAVGGISAVVFGVCWGILLFRYFR